MKINIGGIAKKDLTHRSLDIPSHVAEWADKYFHQSAFDVPTRYPSRKVLEFLSLLKKDQPVRLFRGLNKFNKDTTLITSWTYDRKIAERYAVNGRVAERSFSPLQILLDTTILTNRQRQQLGYDYKFDDKEVLILGY